MRSARGACEASSTFLQATDLGMEMKLSWNVVGW